MYRARLQRQGPRVGTIGLSRLDTFRTFFISTPWQLRKTFFLQYLGNGDGCSLNPFVLQCHTDIVDRQVLLAQLNDLVSYLVTGLHSRARWFDKETAFWVVPKLMSQLVKAADGITEPVGDFRSGQLFDEVRPQGLVLPVRRIARIEKSLGQIHLANG